MTLGKLCYLHIILSRGSCVWVAQLHKGLFCVYVCEHSDIHIFALIYVTSVFNDKPRFDHFHMVL